VLIWCKHSFPILSQESLAIGYSVENTPNDYWRALIITRPSAGRTPSLTAAAAYAHPGSQR
jgi:hypothetical protein